MHQRVLTLRLALSSLTAVGLVACGADRNDAADEGDVRRDRAAVVNGQRSVDRDDGVVELISKPANSTPSQCSGVLVAPNIVLTAIHCVAQYTGGEAFSCSSDGTLSSNRPGDGTVGEVASENQVAVYVGVVPDKTPAAYGIKVVGTGTNQVCRNDFAAVILDRDLDLPLSAIRLLRGVELGESMRVVGYGQTETTGSVGRFERDHLRVIDRGQDAGGSSTGTAAPRTIVTGQGSCHGDSGGPIFSEDTGAVVGVYSLAGGASCTALGVRNVYTRLAPFKDLIEATFASVGRAPMLEPGVADGVGGEGGAATGDGESVLPEQGAGGAAETPVSEAGRATTRPGGSGSSQDDGCACRTTGPRAGKASVGGVIACAVALCFAVLRRRSAKRGG